MRDLQAGHVEVVAALLSSGACVDARTHAGASPLWVAAAKGHAQVVRALLAAGAHVGVQLNNDGTSALKVTPQGTPPSHLGLRCEGVVVLCFLFPFGVILTQD